VRELLGLGVDALPDEPTKKHWVPVHTQIRMVQVIIDEYLGGDPLPFPGLAQRLEHEVHDIGRVVIEVGAIAVRVAGRGAGQ